MISTIAPASKGPAPAGSTARQSASDRTVRRLESGPEAVAAAGEQIAVRTGHRGP